MPGEFPLNYWGIAGCTAQLSPYLPTFRLCFRLGRYRACLPTTERGDFCLLRAAFPLPWIFIFFFWLGEYQNNLNAISLFLCVDVRLDFFFSPYFHQSRLQAVFILEDGFRENVFASPPLCPPLPLFFFSWYMGLAETQTSKLNKKCFCSFPHRSSILTTAKKS